jgi:putative transposase
MATYESLSQSNWACKYHVVLVPKRRKKTLDGKVRKFLGTGLPALASPRRSQMLEGLMVQDHGHRLSRLPPQDAVAAGLGYLKGKAALAVARQLGGRKRNCHGATCWARGVRSIPCRVRSSADAP